MNATTIKKPMSKTCCAGMETMNLPRCEMRLERCEGGCKIYCSCDDANDRRALQAVCEKLAGKMCCMTCSLNGEALCHCCLTCCDRTCECTRTADGVCIACTSNDGNCCDLIQAMCDCIRRCQECGCECTLCCDETPVCCC